jgi:hypothetical protein
LNQHGGGGRRDPFNLLQNGFKKPTVADDLIKLAISFVSVTEPMAFEAFHDVPLSKPCSISILDPAIQSHANGFE